MKLSKSIALLGALTVLTTGCGKTNDKGKDKAKLSVTEQCSAAALIQKEIQDLDLVEITPQQFATLINLRPDARWTAVKVIMSQNSVYDLSFT